MLKIMCHWFSPDKWLSSTINLVISLSMTMFRWLGREYIDQCLLLKMGYICGHLVIFSFRYTWKHFETIRWKKNNWMKMSNNY